MPAGSYELDPKTGKYLYKDGANSNEDKSKVVDDASNTGSAEANDNLTDENSNDVFGRGKAKGDYRLRKYAKASISGISKNFEGDYYLSEVTHTISSNGYEVDFSIKTKLSDIGKTSGENDASASDSADRTPETPIVDNEYILDPSSGTYKLKTAKKATYNNSQQIM